MLILVNKVDNKYHILDTEDMVIEDLSYSDLLNAVRSGVKIDNFDSDLVPKIGRLASQRSEYKYDCIIENNKFWYGTLKDKIYDRPISIVSNGLVCVCKTQGLRDDMNCVVCIGNSLYEITNDDYRIHVNGKKASLSPHYSLQYMGWYGRYFILCFDYGVLYLNEKECQFAKTLSYKSKIRKVVNCKYGDPNSVKMKFLL